MTYRTRIPTDVVDRARETGEVQHWFDDRGYLFSVAWSDEHRTVLSACTGLPPGGDPVRAWERDTPQPDQVEEH